ncbi:MAG: DUF3422 domain-containing protein [Neomegalonema sp.]|nr:DUF3422 domain-containing protein [Neomegalonema sp.]
MQLHSDHPVRVPMIEELHARPFHPLRAPAQVIHYSVLNALPMPQRLERPTQILSAFAGQPVSLGAAVHVFEQPGMVLKFERHSEFDAYTLFVEGNGEAPFEKPLDRLLAPALKDAALSDVVVAARLEVIPSGNEAQMTEAMIHEMTPLFKRESLAVSWAAGRQAMVMGDFQRDEDGLTRFAVLTDPQIGLRRLGRVVQRLIEVETYRAMAMLALPVARERGARLHAISADLTSVIDAINSTDGVSDKTALLERLTAASAELETLGSGSGYRFAASRAYASIVDERIEALREQRVAERQTLDEFMIRRFRPAMRTCEAVEMRMQRLSSRAERAANLLRTKVDVALQAQNRALLASMDRRSETQLRLQETVEGLSVVAISYYAVSLVGYALYPLEKWTGLSGGVMKAMAVIPVVALVWLFLQRMKKRLSGHHKG